MICLVTSFFCAIPHAWAQEHISGRDLELTLRGTNLDTFSASLFYSDQFFADSSYTYNHYLATMSLGLAASGFSTQRSEITAWGLDADCDRQEHIAQAFYQIGVDNERFYNYDISLNNRDGKVAFSIASKTINVNSVDYDLIVIVLRGGGYGAEWANNFVIGESGIYHKGFNDASENVLQGIRQYLDTLSSGNPQKLWITGYSRSAAVANLTAAKLNDSGWIAPENIYAYGFATPQCVIVGDANARNERYHNIFNIINPGDVVPKVAFSKWGFGRFGIDMYLPRTHYGDGNLDTSVSIDPVIPIYETLTQTRNVDRTLIYTNEYETDLNNILDQTLDIILDKHTYESDFQYAIADFVHTLLYQVKNGDGEWGSQGLMETFVKIYGNDGLVALYEVSLHLDLIEKFVDLSAWNEDVYFSVWIFLGLLHLNHVDVDKTISTLLDRVVSPATLLAIIDFWFAGIIDRVSSMAYTIAPGHYPEKYLAWMLAYDSGILFGVPTTYAPEYDEPTQSDPPQDIYHEVREVPQNNMDAILVIDTSGSMGDVSLRSGKRILSFATDAAQVFIDQAFAYNANYRVGLAAFNSGARQLHSLVFKDETEGLRGALLGTQADGRTNIAAGFDTASEMLQREGRTDARQIIVLFSDGMHNESGDPIRSGEAAMRDSQGIARDIYTVGLVGALTEEERRQIRLNLDQPYAVRYIEIDDEQQIEGAFYLLGLAASGGDPEQRINTVRVRGAASVQLMDASTGELLSSASPNRSSSFGSLHMTSDNYEAIYDLKKGTYRLQISGGDVRTIGIIMETLDGRAVTVSQGANLRFNGNEGTRILADLSFDDSSFTLQYLSFDPYTYVGPDPFTGEPFAPAFERKVMPGIANLPNGGLVSQRANGYSASVPNEANREKRVNEQQLEIFNPFFESEGFIVESRTSYGIHHDGYTYFLGGIDMKLYRVPAAGGKRETIVNKKLVAYWVDETGIYYSDGNSIARLEHSGGKATTLVKHKIPNEGNLSRMIRYGDFLYYINKGDGRTIYAIPYGGGQAQKITNEAARCLSIAQVGNKVVIIYNTYDSKKNSEFLRAVDLDGNEVPELQDLRTINTHYFNYANGYLYYCMKNEDCALYRINLNNTHQNEVIARIHATRIFLFDDFVVTTDNSKYFCVMRPDGSEFKTIYAPYPSGIR